MVLSLANVARVRVVACLEPLSSDWTARALPAGGSIASYLEAVGATDPANRYYVALDGDPIPPEDFASTMVTPAGDAWAQVDIRAQPGGGGSSDKDLFDTLVTLGVIAAAWYAAPLVTAALTLGVAWVPMIETALMIGGSRMVSHSTPSQAHAAGFYGDTPRRSAYAGSRNIMNMGGSLPKIRGRDRVFPPHLARPYTEAVGGNTYVRLLLGVLGPVSWDTSTLKLGEDLEIADIVENWDTDVEIREGYKNIPGHDDDDPRAMFAQQVYDAEHDFWIETWWQTGDVYTALNSTEFSIDILFPGGLYTRTLEGTYRAVGVPFEIMISERGQEDWFYPDPENETFTIYGNQREALYHSVRFILPTPADSNGYDVRIRHGDIILEYGGVQAYAVFLSKVTFLQSIHNEDPIAIDSDDRADPVGVATITLRLPINDETMTLLDRVNIVATSVVPVYNGAAWVWEESRSPAWLLADCWTGRQNVIAKPLSAIDTDAFEDFAAFCTENEFNYDGISEAVVGVKERAREIAAVGLGSPTKKDTLYSVIWDHEQTEPAQQFNDRNARDYTATRIYSNVPHGVRCQFRDPEIAYQQNDAPAFREGYDENTATIYETLGCPGVSSRTHAWKLGRHRLKELQLRPIVHEWISGLEQIICRRGALVRHRHAAILRGLHSGRIKSTVDAGGARSGSVSSINVDEKVYMETGTSYAVTIRMVGEDDPGNLTEITREVVTAPGWSTALRFVVPIPDTQELPQAGDMFSFGVLGTVTADLVVTQIRPHTDGSASFMAMDAAPGIHDPEAPPVYDPQITVPPDYDYLGPLPPQIVHIQTDETVLVRDTSGNLISRIVLTLRHGSGNRPPPAWTKVQYRHSPIDVPPGPWLSMPTFDGSPTTVWVDNVLDGEYYDVLVYTISAAHRNSRKFPRSGVYVIGKTTPPPAPVGLHRDRDVLKWSIEDPPLDLRGFEIRLHLGDSPTWEDAIKIHEGFISHTLFTLPDLGPGQTFTFYAKSVDYAANPNYSVDAAVLTCELEPHERYNLEGDPTDWKIGLGAPNPVWDLVTITNGTVDGADDIVADLAFATPFWGEDPDRFWGLNPDPFWDESSTTYEEMTVELTNSWIWGGGARAKMLQEFDASGATITLYYKYGHTQEDYPGDDYPWSPWPASIWIEDNDWYRLKFVFAGGPTQGVLREWSSLFAYPDVTEFVVDHVIATAGDPERVPLVETYSVIQVVSVTITAGTAIGARVTDKDPTLGIRVFLYDSDGNATTGTIDVFVKGYLGP